jgi:DNA-binding response OmpR family regulator
MSTRILFVDDDSGYSAALALWFSNQGFVVDTACNAEDAIAMCQERAFDIVTLDSEMPGSSGEEAIPRIRALLPGTHIVMITGNAAIDERCNANPPDALLRKPIAMKSILSSINMLLGR